MQTNLAWLLSVAVLVAVGTSAGRAGAQAIDFTDFDERAVLIQTEDTYCFNPAAPTTGLSPALSTPDPGCFVFANGVGVDFSDPTTDFFGVLTHVTGTQWVLTVPQPVWLEVLETVLGGIGATVETTTANQLTFNSAGGPVVPTLATFYTATATFGTSQLYLEGLPSTPDTVYFGSARPPPGETFNVPLEFSCAGTQTFGALSALGPFPADVFATTTFCDPPGGSTNYLTSPGFAGTSLTAFMASAIRFGSVPGGTPASSPVWTPLDWRLQETPDTDGDLVPDLFDNCDEVPNLGQEDIGGVGAGSFPDGIGDACQCGDVNNDGRVTSGDATTLARALLTPPTTCGATTGAGDCAGGFKCDANNSNTCSSADATIIARMLLTPPTATINPGCGPAAIVP